MIRARAAIVPVLVLIGALSLSLPSGDAAAPHAASVVSVPTAGALYKDGQSGRYLLGGTWLFRYDRGVGLARGFERSTSTAGWKTIGVPNAWNAGQYGPKSFTGTVAWYRRDFRLPSADTATTWIVRFESVNQHATVWLNGQQIGTHTGAFLAFEIALPKAALHRDGVNRLVVRVDDHHSATELPPSGSSGSGHGYVGGWWNYGGLLREVYLRRVNGIDIEQALVVPHLPCASCAARISYTVIVHNYDARPQRVRLSSSFGAISHSLGTVTVPSQGSTTLRASLAVAKPVLWWPHRPYLYDVAIDARSARGGQHSHYSLESGIRRVSVSGGRLFLNFEPLSFRGVGLIEDSPSAGSAISDAVRAQLIQRARELGATVIRSQYPFDPYLEQLADELGVMLWSEIPVYQVKETALAAATPAAVAMLSQNILQNGSHPSIILWSIGNELAPTVGPAQSTYIRRAVATARSLDPTRPTAIAIAGYPSVGCQAGYLPLSVIGINDYFGWYPGPQGQIADPSLLAPYLATVRACYGRQALVVSEFGAEADRNGPTDERGTYAYQSAYAAMQLSILATVPSLSGAIWWALQDFAVKPGWSGGDPYPNSPLFQKGLLSQTDLAKPAFAVVQAAFASVTQVPGSP